MADRYEFFDHTADLGVRVWGRTLEDLFLNAAAALYEALGTFAPLTDSSGDSRRTVDLRADTLEDLLHDWLSELLYDFETHHYLYGEMKILELTPRQLSATLLGNTVDLTRSHTRQEIKAVTYHELAVERLHDGPWQATLVFDV